MADNPNEDACLQPLSQNEEPEFGVIPDIPIPPASEVTPKTTDLRPGRVIYSDTKGVKLVDSFVDYGDQRTTINISCTSFEFGRIIAETCKVRKIYLAEWGSSSQRS